MLEVDVRLARDGFELATAFRPRDRVTGLFGPSGSGKTTLLHVIAGLVRPDRGRVVLGERVLFDADRRIDVPTHRRRVGLLFQEDRLLPHYSVAGNLRYGAGRGARPGAALGFDDVVDLLELGAVLGRRVGALSGGERRRVALGRTLLAAPELLLLDEPLAALDRRLRGQILPFLRKACAAARVPVVYVSHELTEILRLTDHLAVLDEGRLVGHGAFGELTRQVPVLDAIHDRGLTNVLAVTVADPGPPTGLARLALGADGDATDAALAARPCPAPAGSTVHVAVHPTDIALAAARVPSISIRNQMPGRVVRLTPHRGRLLVEVDVGRPLLAEVSEPAAAELALAPGATAWCLIKSNSVEYL
ncbi:MAG: molybdenum ABC transporter ATP-binding protein [Planctomycetota bacterium]|jgi:molybdate transport system ATP-binding protein